MNTVIINNFPMQVKEYNGQRVITFKDIDTVHQRPEGTASRNFKANRKRFIDGVDFYIVKPSDFQIDEFRPSEINNRGTTLLTESGYLMLVKSFTDELAWTVQRQLVNSYFRLAEVLHTQCPETSIEIEEMNARVRMSSQFLKLAKTKAIPKQYRDSLLKKSIEVLTGETIPEHIVINSDNYNPVSENAEYILNRLKETGIEEATTRDIMRLCRKLKKVAEVKEAIEFLKGIGYIVEVPVKGCGVGRKPKPKYKVKK